MNQLNNIDLDFYFWEVASGVNSDEGLSPQQAQLSLPLSAASSVSTTTSNVSRSQRQIDTTSLQSMWELAADVDHDP